MRWRDDSSTGRAAQQARSRRLYVPLAPIRQQGQGSTQGVCARGASETP